MLLFAHNFAILFSIKTRRENSCPVFDPFQTCATMPMRFLIFPAAQCDLEQAIDYLNTLSPQAAIRYYDLLVCEIAGLSKMPERCPRPKDLALAAKGYRYLIVKNYLVFYVVAGDTVQIRRTLYARRGYRALL